ncbi:hypothetical protein JN01_0286 [Entomoplasma freundtii]|uniref:ATP-binding protein n=1 Tax=Entomoplasma freundtii TaxID=74700 RepID=A0A2K8NR30_9MOLU|nr:DUF2075 domain-containing protein [Entomoplasma freundtii]ATZ16300.1 ATP-binding protein [Entomoplasma freundtii]TDY56798.1 hypothetical protein JN01_0286 [Entomoplasma freundtii]
MIIYQENKDNFLEDIQNRDIQDKIADFYLEKLGKRPSPSEKRSWQNSLTEVYYVLNDQRIPNESRVTIEYNLPSTNRRIDVIVSGTDNQGKPTAILIELKQWEKANLVATKDGLVTTFLGGNPNRETVHPSYQVWSYFQFMKDYSRLYHQEKLAFIICAYLHNYKKANNEPLLDKHYEYYTKEAPIFFNGDNRLLSDYISHTIKGPDEQGIINRLDQEPKQPSKSLQNDISSLILENEDFVLLDSQKIAFEEIKSLTKKSKNDSQKRVVIIEGAPGTGKSVIAFQLLASFLKQSMSVSYISKNAALRSVFSTKLINKKSNKNDQGQRLTKSRLDNLMMGSGSFYKTMPNTYDVLLVDEAHRLNFKSGMFKNKGENQIKEIIESTLVSVFFVDDKQQVTSSDIGSKVQILTDAKSMNVRPENIKILNLNSQFRMSGSNNFLEWLDFALGLASLNESLKPDLTLDGYDFKIYDSIDEMTNDLETKNNLNNKTRLVAGYCWDWVSKKDPNSYDIDLSPTFKKQWNLSNDNTWAISENSFEQVGCIHTSQGLEFDYVGVIVGPDLYIKNGLLKTNPLARAKTDKSLNGLIGLIKKGDQESLDKAKLIILNTYRVLFTRGTKGCYIYFTDPEVKEYFQNLLIKNCNE